MLNTMIVVKMKNTNFSEWEKLFDDDAENRSKFARDNLFGKVYENTTIVTADIFDPEGMKKRLSDPELGKDFEEIGIEHKIYMFHPTPKPGS